MKIRAAVLEAFGTPLVVQQVDLVEPGPGEALVRLVACGVCHTDAYSASGVDPTGYAPCVLGHEGAGIVERIGDGVRFIGARLAGAERIIAIDLSAERLEQARHHGATDVRLADDETVDWIRSETGGYGVDYIAGSPVTSTSSRFCRTASPLTRSTTA